ncbi:MAG TPA: hypothetical protein VHA33_19640 [Candidatus Angelobacter sp.]|nr:hypothetical protein [Candidatus Angelobacter sp.]
MDDRPPPLLPRIWTEQTARLCWADTLAALSPGLWRTDGKALAVSPEIWAEQMARLR